MLDNFWLLSSGSIPGRIQLVAVVGSVLLMVVIIRLIQKERLKEGYSIIWFVVGLCMILFSVLARLLDVFARVIGIAYAPAALFFILIAGLIILSIHFSVLLSKYDRRIKELAQDYAILRHTIEEKDKHQL